MVLKRRDVMKGALALGAVSTLGAPAVLGQSGVGKIQLLATTSPPDPQGHFLWWAQEKGFYRDAGVDVTIRSIVADTTTVRGLVAGEGDIGWAGAGSGMQSMAAGSRLKILSSFAPRLDFIIIGNDQVTDLKSLEGHLFAVSQVGAVSYTVPKLMIEQANGNSGNVRWVSVGGSGARLAAMLAKRVDGTILTSLQSIEGLKNKNFHTLGIALKELPNFLYSWEIVSQNALASKPEALKAFVAACARAASWGMDHPDEASEVSQKVLPDVAPDDVAIVIHDYAKNGYFDRTGKVNRDSWKFTVDTMMKDGGLTTPLAYADWITDYAAAPV
jgi:NitT/TauT family transport system substrate-binding protein